MLRQNCSLFAFQCSYWLGKVMVRKKDGGRTQTAREFRDAEIRAMLQRRHGVRKLHPCLSGTEEFQREGKRHAYYASAQTFPKELLEPIEGLGRFRDQTLSRHHVRSGSQRHSRLLHHPSLHGKVSAYSAHLLRQPEDRVRFRGRTS